MIDHYRRSNRQELPLDYIFETNNYLTDKTITNLDKSLDADNLLRQLSQLKPEYQEILLLRYVEDLSIEDISQIIEKDKNNVRVILHRALNKLKEITEK